MSGTSAPAKREPLDRAWVEETLTVLRDTIDEMQGNAYTDAEDGEIMRKAMQAILADYTVDRNLRAERAAALEEAKALALKLRALDDVIARRNEFMQSLVDRLDFSSPIVRDAVGTPLVQRQLKLAAARSELLGRYTKLTGTDFYADYPPPQPTAMAPPTAQPMVKPMVQPPMVKPMVQPPMVKPMVQPPMVKPMVQPMAPPPVQAPHMARSRPNAQAPRTAHTAAQPNAQAPHTAQPVAQTRDQRMAHGAVAAAVQPNSARRTSAPDPAQNLVPSPLHGPTHSSGRGQVQGGEEPRGRQSTEPPRGARTKHVPRRTPFGTTTRSEHAASHARSDMRDDARSQGGRSRGERSRDGKRSREERARGERDDRSRDRSRARDDRCLNNRSSGDGSRGDRSSGDRSRGDRSGNNRSGGDRSRDDRSSGDRSGNNRSQEDRQKEDRARVERHSGGRRARSDSRGSGLGDDDDVSPHPRAGRGFGAAKPESAVSVRSDASDSPPSIRTAARYLQSPPPVRSVSVSPRRHNIHLAEEDPAPRPTRSTARSPPMSSPAILRPGTLPGAANDNDAYTSPDAGQCQDAGPCQDTGQTYTAAASRHSSSPDPLQSNEGRENGLDELDVPVDEDAEWVQMQTVLQRMTARYGSDVQAPDLLASPQRTSTPESPARSYQSQSPSQETSAATLLYALDTM